MGCVISGVMITPLKKIFHPKGEVLHALKSGENSFCGFGEAYFSCVDHGQKKGWKKHLRMTLNLVVPVGSIRFALYDAREDSPTYLKKMQVTCSREQYRRLTIPPGIWVAFEGLGNENMLLNVANMQHDPEESINISEAELFGENGFADEAGEIWVE